MGKSGLFDIINQQPILVPKSDSCWILPEQFLGLEIEIEDYKQVQVNKLLRTSSHWSSVEDHSLRNGIELVFSQALMGKQLTDAINEFYDNVSTFSNGPRTSIHVHVNMRQEEDTPESLRNLVVLYYMYEDAFFSIAQEERKWCSYCNPFEDSPPDVLTAVIRGESLKEIRRQIVLAAEGRTNRYYGLNLLALARHGTVEFRHMPCVKERERVVEWIQIIMELKAAATAMAEAGTGPFDLFTDVNLLSRLIDFMPKFGHRFRELVPDAVAYRKLGLASMYRSGDVRQSFGAVKGNATFNRYLEKILGSAAVASAKTKKAFDYQDMMRIRDEMAREVAAPAPTARRRNRARISDFDAEAMPLSVSERSLSETGRWVSDDTITGISARTPRNLSRPLTRHELQVLSSFTANELAAYNQLMQIGIAQQDAVMAIAQQRI